MISRTEQDLVKSLLKQSKKAALAADEDYNAHAARLLVMSEDEVRKVLSSAKASLAQGTISESLWNSLVKLYICLRRKRALTGLNDSAKKKIDENLVEVMKLLFLQADNQEGEQNKRYLEDFVVLLYNLVESDQVPNKEQHSKFKEKVRSIVNTEYPIYKKQGKKEIIIKEVSAAPKKVL